MLVQHELLLFAGVFFLLGAADELGVDLMWLWLKLTGRAETPEISEEERGGDRLRGLAAVFIPAWQEDAVIGATIRHALTVWPHRQLRIYVGCYANDPATISEVVAAAHGDIRVRIVINDRAGPTTKADCLNRLYQALATDEHREGFRARMVVLHDAEDMVHENALALMDGAITQSDLIQLPVLPEPQPHSRWIAGHYCEEFAEAHGKAMVVRDALRVGMPLAGVGCAISRETLPRLASGKADGKPFAADCLTEDYEIGIGVSDIGGTARFIRRCDNAGNLVATRACFPAKLDDAVRQKTRWVHGIAFQGWEHLGWSSRPAELWMRLRDRRGPFTALVLAMAYLLLVLSAAIWAFNWFGFGKPLVLSPTLQAVLWLNFGSFAWRAGWRFVMTAGEYGWREGIRSVMRIPVANIIAIMAGRRAFTAYLRSFSGQLPVWDKTSHAAHPVLMIAQGKTV